MSHAKHSTRHSHADPGKASLSREHVKLPELDIQFLRTAKDIGTKPAETFAAEKADRIVLVLLAKDGSDNHHFVEMEKNPIDSSWKCSVRLKQGSYQYLFMVVSENGDHILCVDRKANGQQRADIEGQERPVSILMVTGHA